MPLYPCSAADGPLAAKEIFRKAKADGFKRRLSVSPAGIKHYREGFGAKGKSMWPLEMGISSSNRV